MISWILMRVEHQPAQKDSVVSVVLMGLLVLEVLSVLVISLVLETSVAMMALPVLVAGVRRSERER